MLKFRSMHWLIVSAMVVSLATSGCGRVKIGVRPLPSPTPSPSIEASGGGRDHQRPPVSQFPDLPEHPNKPDHRPSASTGNGSTHRPGHSVVRYGKVRVLLTRAARFRITELSLLQSVARVRLSLTQARVEEPMIKEVGPEILDMETPSVTFDHVRTGNATLVGEAFDIEDSSLGSVEVPVSISSNTTSEVEVAVLTPEPDTTGNVTADITLQEAVPQ